VKANKENHRSLWQKRRRLGIEPTQMWNDVQAMISEEDDDEIVTDRNNNNTVYIEPEPTGVEITDIQQTYTTP